MRPRLTLLCELDGEELVSLARATAPVLARLGARVGLALRDLSEARASALLTWQSAGIPCVAWIVVAPEDGYWLHAGNPRAATDCIERLVEWSGARGLSFEAAAFDIEPSRFDEEALPTAGWRLAPRLLRRRLTLSGLRDAEAQWAEVSRLARSLSPTLLAYQAPVILDERRARSTLVRRTLGTVDPPVDRVVPMLYSSFLRPAGAAMVASYAAGLDEVAVGSTGGGVPYGGLDRVRPLDWDELARDLRLVRHAREVHVFSLEGSARQHHLERLVDFDWDAPVRAFGTSALGAVRRLGSLLLRLG